MAVCQAPFDAECSAPIAGKPAPTVVLGFADLAYTLQACDGGVSGAIDAECSAPTVVLGFADLAYTQQACVGAGLPAMAV